MECNAKTPRAKSKHAKNQWKRRARKKVSTVELCVCSPALAVKFSATWIEGSPCAGVFDAHWSVQLVEQLVLQRHRHRRRGCGGRGRGRGVLCLERRRGLGRNTWRLGCRGAAAATASRGRGVGAEGVPRVPRGRGEGAEGASAARATRVARAGRHLLPAAASRVGHVLGCAFLSTSIILRSATLK